MNDHMTIRGYARSRRCSEATIRYHISKNVIVLDKHGKIDPEQADLAWARRRHNRPGSDSGSQAANARIRKMRAKLALARDQVAKLDDEYAERSTAVAQYGAEADYVLDALRAMPALEAEHLAEQLGITPEKARQVLDEFVRLCLTDLGDLRGRLVKVVGRV